MGNPNEEHDEFEESNLMHGKIILILIIMIIIIKHIYRGKSNQR